MDSQTYTGYRFSTGWAKDQRLYFAIRLSKPVRISSIFDNGKFVTGDSIKSEKVVGVLNFSTRKRDIIILKVGISPVSEKNALANIDSEVPEWDFEKVVSDANKLWNKELGKIIVTGKNNNELRIFLYSIVPFVYSPVTF